MRLAVSIILGLAILAGAYFLKGNIADTKKPDRGAAPKITNTVFVQNVTNKDLPIFIETNGTIKAQERIELFSEVQGVLKPTKKAFKPGQHYVKGELLLEMDSQEFYSSLVSQRSLLYNNIVSIMPDLKFDLAESFQQWQSYLDAFDIQKNINELPKALNKKEKYFINSKQIVSTYYTIKNLEERFVKYKIRSPFNGILIEALVDPGTLVRTGQKLGGLINPAIFELEASMNAEYLEFLKVGKRVTVKDLKGKRTWLGFVKRINGVIDPATQTVPVYIQVSGSGLTEGMFLEASVMAASEHDVMEISRSLLGADGAVFVVKNDSILTSVPVEVVNYTDKSMMVRGLQDGMALLSKPLPGAYEGMVVQIANQ